MQKRPMNPNPGPSKASGSMPKANPNPPGHLPQAANAMQRKIAPKPMVTAADRQQAKEQRRAATATGYHKPPIIPGVPDAARTPGAASATPPPATPPPAASAAAASAAAGAAGTALSENLEAQISQFNALQDQIMLTPVNDDLEDIATAINALPANIENIRARGYVFKSFLERKVETLNKQWTELRPQVQAAVQTQTAQLRLDANQVQAALNRRQLATAPLASLEGKVSAALRNLQGMYDTLDNNVNQTQQQIDDISWTLQQVELASFGFLATEAAVEAVPANWKKPGDKDGVEGVLILTDQRLLFEQKEEVATKKVLFITTAKQKVQALQWAVPISQIDKATGSNRGLMGKDDFLTLTLAESSGLVGPEGQALYDDMGRPLRTTEIHLKGEDGEAWQGFVGRVKSGEIAKERTTPVDTAAAETVANAPTKCPNCGATITQTILRGQTELTCEFCGSVIRL
ncbi:MAG: TFIIB-type zinc ribbon-containing protein [Anaerolineales bacterium]|nr:TFIIB-type zinc ribbon-containing protein [Anaerolineales bacterium]